MEDRIIWAWEEDDEIDLKEQKQTLPTLKTLEENTNSSNNNEKSLSESKQDNKRDTFFDWDMEDDNEEFYSLNKQDNIPWKDIIPSDYGNKKILKNIEKEENKTTKRKSTLTEEQRFGHKGIPLNGEEVGVFHYNKQSNSGIQSMENNLHSLLDIDLSEETQEEVNHIIDKKVEALGQYTVLNDKSRLVEFEDGTTVADIIKKKRRKKTDPIKEVKKQKLQEKYDNPDYAKSFKRYQEEVQKKIRNYSRVHKKEANKSKGSYIDRLKSGNSYKNLLKTLNVKQEELSELLSENNKLLSKKEKERLLTMGINTPIYTAPVLNKNGNKVRGLKRPTLTFGDYMLMDFLYRFSHSGLNTISLALGRDLNKVANQLNKLMKMACIKEQQLLGTKYVYYLSSAGYTMLTGEPVKYGVDKIKEGTISNKAITNYVGALLYSNRVNVLDLDDYPNKHRYFRGKYYNGETIIPERFYKSSLSSMANKFETGYKAGAKRNEIGRNRFNKLWLEWEANGKQGPSPEELIGNEFMYILYPTGILNQGTVIPDLVVKRDRKDDDKPQNIAVEIERENRKKEYYVNRLRVYQQDKKIYKEVVYIVNEKSVAKKLIEARDLIGFDRLRIVALRDLKGKPMPKIKDVWRLI